MVKKAVDTEANRLSRRKSKRYTSTAHVNIDGFDGYALLRDISEHGFLMASKTYAAINRGERYTMRIIPEKETKLTDIELEVEVRWTRIKEDLFAVGFQILSPSAALRSYIKYLEPRQ